MSQDKYIVSARKYRPSTFNTVVGQEALTHTLKTSIASGRLAHAYLFCGPRGVGKTTCARIFAKTINCTNITADGEACNECESCRAFNEQSSFNIVELDAASNNGVDDIRELNGQVLIPPHTGKYKVYIIDEVHMLSQAAFNAFLKTLEEPPEYAIFILATTEKQKIIPTILSRCQIYDFTRITVPDIVKQLERICEVENIKAEPAALNIIAQKADGGMRDALSIFDQVTASSEGNITYQSTIENLNVLDYDYYFRVVECCLTGDVPQSLLIYKEIRDKGFDSQFFINGLAQHLRDLMVASTPSTKTLLEMNEEVSERYVQQAAKLPAGFFYRALDLCNTCDLNYRNATNKQLIVELTLVKLCQIMVPTPAPVATPSTPPLRKITPPASQPTPAQAAPAQAAPAPTPTSTYAQSIPQPQVVSEPQPRVMASEHRVKPQAQAISSRIYVNKKVSPANEDKRPETADTKGVRREPFTKEQVLVAWKQYIKDHPHEKLVVSAMTSSEPQNESDTQYFIELTSQAQVTFMEGSKPAIMEYLRNAVKNDMLALEIRLNESKPEKKIYTPREIVEEIKQHNPQFKSFIKDFQLGLA
ncbi:MAG: DNA polymerase III subunit gamma/tau [Muribaculaceae bacterium]|nr:DNA polymerase III subunit gamma/tau [Muribaculaceae bacterium]